MVSKMYSWLEYFTCPGWV